MPAFSKENRILLKELVKTDFKLRYQGSVIGYLWSILKPLMMFLIMYVVFIHFLRIGGDVPHFAVALLLANIIWSFFSEATGMGMGSIVSRGDLIRKLNFSKSIIVLSSVCGALINFGINLIVVILFCVANGVVFTPRVLWAIPLILELFIFSYGVSLLLAVLFVKFRDTMQIWEVFMQAGMYATPIIYPLSFMADKSMLAARIVMLNPVAQIIQDLRYVLVDPVNTTIWQLSHNPIYIAIPYTIPFVVLGVGLLVFNHNAKRFAEVI